VPVRKKKLLKRNRKRKAKVQVVSAIDWSSIELPVINWARVATFSSAGAIMVAFYVATLWIMDRPIDAVVINGAFERVTAVELEDLLTKHLQTGFLGADLGAIRAEVTGIPWVANATVRRRWPGSIEVGIVEQRPAATWGERGLLNTDGELFVDNATHVLAELPKLQGPAGSEQRVAEMYFNVDKRLQQYGIAAHAVSLDKRGAWELQLSNGISVRLGAKAVGDRLDRFFAALDSAVTLKLEQVDYIDMRYPNGFAIGWKAQKPLRAESEEGVQPNV
jgi:cell division protein FtsQ